MGLFQNGYLQKTDVTQALKGIKSSDSVVPLNPKDSNPVMAVMQQLQGE